LQDLSITDPEIRERYCKKKGAEYKKEWWPRMNAPAGAILQICSRSVSPEKSAWASGGGERRGRFEWRVNRVYLGV